ncbi:MAG: glycosyltransferase family 8 protein [Bacteroidales bacterium]
MLDTPIEIAIASNSAYIVPTTVLLKSLFENHKEGELSINLLYISSDTTPKDIEFWRSYTESHGQIFTDIPVNFEVLEEFPNTRHSKTAYLRLFATQILPSKSKLLYIDADTIVCTSLIKLWKEDIINHYAASVKTETNAYIKSNEQIKQHLLSLKIPHNHSYFHSGVVLFNLELMKTDNILEKFISFGKKHANLLIWPDQDILNSCLAGRVKYLPPKYNMNFMIERDIPYQVWSSKEIHEAQKHPVIIHYIGPVKPWHYLSVHPKNSLWWYYLSLTPFASFQCADYKFSLIPKKLFLYASKFIERNLTLAQKRFLGKIFPKKLTQLIKSIMGKN